MSPEIRATLREGQAILFEAVLAVIAFGLLPTLYAVAFFGRG